MGILTKILALGFLVSVLASCSSTTKTFLVNHPVGREKKARYVRVYLEEPDRPVAPMAVIAVSRMGENAVWAMEEIKDEAGSIGADAVTHVELHYTPGIFPSLRVQAVAVKYE